MDILLTALGGFIFLSLFIFCFISIREKEKRAAVRSLLLAATIPLPYLLLAFLDFPGRLTAGSVLAWFSIGIVFLFLIPTGRSRFIKQGIPQDRFDERDVMFSRYFMEVDSPQYKDYYQRNPDKLETDTKFRNAPGLLSPTAMYSHPFYFASADVGFAMCDYLSEHSGEISAPRQADPAELANYLKHWLIHMGALSVGFTKLEDYHWYSVKGRGDDYGKPVDPSHPYALAVTIEMDYYMIRTGPQAPEAMEVAWKYLEVATLAVQAAAFIRRMGYSAQAHIDGNYQVLCPLVARDAGLGEIGRMGLLITPECGPRVRIAVITTDLPFPLDEHPFDSDIIDTSVIDFCNKCQKCALCCPTQAIPRGERQEENGVLRWRINHEKCFSFWCAAGSDCGTCLSVCPYSHPAGSIHNTIRSLSRNSSLFRTIAPPMDDLLYGKKPKPFPMPEWTNL